MSSLRRPDRTMARAAGRLVVCLALTMVLIGLVFELAGADPFEAFEALIDGALGNPLGVEQTIELGALLVVAGLAVAIPARASLWNIGGEGQIFAGALAAVTVALKLTGVPPALVMVLALLAGGIAGAAVAAIAGALKARAGANEVLTTLMLNFIVILFTFYAIGHWFPAAGIRASTPEVPADVELPNLLGGEITSGVALALACVLIGHLIMSRTRLGLKIRATGASPDAARHNGVRVPHVYMAAFGIGGAFAGLAGAIVVLGIDGLLSRDFSPGYGFVGVAVALLARSRPLLIVPAAALFSVVTVGGSYLEAAVGLSADVALVVQGLLLLMLLAMWVLPPERPAGAR